MTQIEMLRNVAAGAEVTDEMRAIAAEMVEKRANAKRKPTEKELAKRAENEKLKELVEDAVEAASLDDVRDWSIGHRLRLIRQARELGIEV
jgi:citrate lyase alpha subunit